MSADYMAIARACGAIGGTELVIDRPSLAAFVERIQAAASERAAVICDAEVRRLSEAGEHRAALAVGIAASAIRAPIPRQP